jgi:hypothetical protein
MAQILNEINLGAVLKYNGMTMFRKIALSQAFIPMYEVSEDGENLLSTSKIIVTYNEYIKNADGEVITALSENLKRYILQDEEVWKPVSKLFSELARTPTSLAVGLLDTIEMTLGVIPQDAPDCYVVKSTDFPS